MGSSSSDFFYNLFAQTYFAFDIFCLSRRCQLTYRNIYTCHSMLNEPTFALIVIDSNQFTTLELKFCVINVYSLLLNEKLQTFCTT